MNAPSTATFLLFLGLLKSFDQLFQRGLNLLLHGVGVGVGVDRLAVS